MTEAERLAIELLQPIDGFEEPTYLETQAAELLRKLQSENESLRERLDAAIADKADLFRIYEQRCAELDAAMVDAERYKWLRRNLVGLSFSDSLIASLCKDQSELDATMGETK